MPTLILSPRYSDDSIALWRAAQKLGWQVLRLLSWKIPQELKQQDNIVIYGEGLFAAAVSQQLSLSLLEPEFDWLTNIPNNYKLRQVDFMTLEQAKNLKVEKFIKPADDKTFPAKVYKNGLDLPNLETLTPSTPVLVSDVVSWEIEFRCFILNGKLTTLSPYLHNGILVKTILGDWITSEINLQQAKSFIGKVLEDLQDTLPPAVVVDIGKIHDLGWAIIEANPAWASGIYGCDPKEVLNTISFSCPKEVTSFNKKWVIKRDY